MTNQQTTQPPPPPGARQQTWQPRQVDEPKVIATNFVAFWFLLAAAGWIGSALLVWTAADADDPPTRYFLGVVFAVIASGIAVVATLYDIAGRHRS